MIRSLSYSWGLYLRAQAGMPTDRGVALTWSAADLPSGVAAACVSERIRGLAGTFGDETLGEPLEIDDLDGEMDTDRVRIRVYSCGIGLMRGVEPDLAQLHGFFSMPAATNGGPGPEAT
jgi:hypothetical protein